MFSEKLKEMTEEQLEELLSNEISANISIYNESDRFSESRDEIKKKQKKMKEQEVALQRSIFYYSQL